MEVDHIKASRAGLFRKIRWVPYCVKFAHVFYTLCNISQAIMDGDAQTIVESRSDRKKVLWSNCAPTLFFKCCSDCDFSLSHFNLPVFVHFPAVGFFTSWVAVQSGLCWALNGCTSWRRLHFVNLSTDVRFRPTGQNQKKRAVVHVSVSEPFTSWKWRCDGLVWF